MCAGAVTKSMVKLAAFCDWLLREFKSSSWPALPFPLLCWEESLWLLIVQIWLSFTLKAWKIKYLLMAYEIFVHLKNIRGHCDQSWKDTLILWFIWINIYICHIYRFSLGCWMCFGAHRNIIARRYLSLSAVCRGSCNQCWEKRENTVSVWHWLC